MSFRHMRLLLCSLKDLILDHLDLYVKIDALSRTRWPE